MPELNVTYFISKYGRYWSVSMKTNQSDHITLVAIVAYKKGAISLVDHFKELIGKENVILIFE